MLQSIDSNKQKNVIKKHPHLISDSNKTIKCKIDIFSDDIYILNVYCTYFRDSHYWKGLEQSVSGQCRVVLLQSSLSESGERYRKKNNQLIIHSFLVKFQLISENELIDISARLSTITYQVL